MAKVMEQNASDPIAVDMRGGRRALRVCLKTKKSVSWRIETQRSSRVDAPFVRTGHSAPSCPRLSTTTRRFARAPFLFPKKRCLSMI